MPREPNRSSTQRQRPVDSAPMLDAARRHRRHDAAGPRRFCLGTAPVRESDLRVGPLAARRAAFAASAPRTPTPDNDGNVDCDPRDYGRRVGDDQNDDDDNLLDQVAEAGSDDDRPAEPIDSDDDDDGAASAEAWRRARARRWRRPARHPLTLSLVLPFNRDRMWPAGDASASIDDSQ
ncbi:hypothetical protein pqer_cds_48 [Pandoravirus quercus]|uniref:Uncharacterized protein n=2 Tax=Pandoravirus TaxID=2060084 RepID=A0A2U7U7R8_9VIRU|nr:hypothetical protein pqer_cds_48 [Pandoravirus quercus]AVK74470.1 hypothetical protein pqer_cds_48 [Pandoravirus quercus]QBZ80642.1 hypothetical protein pclt_cds_44 [Pandoravirus celtis]